MKKIKEFLKKETVLSIAVLSAIVSSFFNVPQASYIDADVLCILFSLMLVVEGLKNIKFLDWIALSLLKRCIDFRQVAVVLIGITFIASMFVTNDVALITFVPLTLIIGKSVKMDVAQVIVLQTIAANLGSMVTPMGNPQNLFLYAHYGFTASEFFKVMLLPAVLSVFYIGLIIGSSKNIKFNLKLTEQDQLNTVKTVIFISLLMFNIAAVLHIMDKFLALLITVLTVAVINFRLLKSVDYSLLITFIGFFIFIGNISHADFVVYLKNNVLNSMEGTYLAAVISSQFISNVPAAMLLAALTSEAEALLLGVNIGGLGTLIASMASVISYKLFVSEHPYQAGTYLKTFLFYNFAGLISIGSVVYIFLEFLVVK